MSHDHPNDVLRSALYAKLSIEINDLQIACIVIS